MKKLKTRKAVAKRFRATASGKLKCMHSNMSHILTKKSAKRKRRLRKGGYVHPDVAARFKTSLPYGTIL